MSRSAIAASMILAASLTSSTLRAGDSAPVIVSMRGSAELRVQVSEGLTRPCDSPNNRMLFDGRLKPGQSYRGAIAGDCVCVRNTTSSFPDADWTTPGLVCRPRICRGRVCRPAPEPTIAISLP